MNFDEYKNEIQKIEPSDYAELLKMGRKWGAVDERPYDIKIAVIGTTSLQWIVSVLRGILCGYDIYADVYEGEYDGISMDVFDENSALYRFHPSYMIIIPDYRDIYNQAPDILSGRDAVERAVSSVLEYYKKIFNTVHDRLPECQIMFSNFVEPVEDPLGNMGGNYLFSQSQFYRMVNLQLVIDRPPFVTIVDIDKLSACIGKYKWFNDGHYYLNKSGFSLEYIGYFCDAFARLFAAFMGRVKKCVVLDLDNTLWGGEVGDVGYKGIQLDSNDAEGEAYIHFQRYLLQLKNRGVILAVCSKNDLENAKEPFEKNENMVLHMDDFSVFIANWNDKTSNIRIIAGKLNIGLDSLVFFDDSPTEREAVREFLPEVKVIDVPRDPADYVRALDQSFCFEWNQITKEDITRVQSYRDNSSRMDLLQHCGNYNEFLGKLGMLAHWEPVSDRSMERFLQLTNKSNQFNLRTRRYNESEIERMIISEKFGLYEVSLKDRFSNYGIIACVVLRIEDDFCEIENWVMSCRVLKKTVEVYTFYKILQEAKERNVEGIKAEYIQSKKNGMVNDLYDRLGFEIIDESDSHKKYLLKKERFSIVQQKLTFFVEEDF